VESRLAASRNPVAEIIAACEPLLDEDHRLPRDRDAVNLSVVALRRKLDALASGTFTFLRGTFHLMAADLLQGRVPGWAPLAPVGLAVGDLHLENFGTYRGASGALCFDVNDFDDVGLGPLDLDLKRLCTSAMLLPGVDRAIRVAAAGRIAHVWAEAVERLGGRFPIAAWDMEKADGWLRELLREKGRRTIADLLAKVAPGKGHCRFGEDGDPPRFAHTAKPWPERVDAGLGEYFENLAKLKADVPGRGWEPLDVAYWFKGTGSLGRLRFAVLLGKGDERMMIELKEAHPSAMELASGRQVRAMERARVQTAAIRRLQGDPWPRVAGTHLGKLPALGREIEPEEEKIQCERFKGAGGDQLFAYAHQCGEVLARLHCRMNAPVLLDAAWSLAEAARAAVSFAESYAGVVEADWRGFVDAHSRIAQELALPV